VIISDELPPHLQKQVDHNLPGTDILHGELKNLMLEAENMMLTRSNPDYKKYWEGQLDALTHVYQLTYNLTFAIDDRRKNEAR
jgi:hypothetical protein